MRTYHIGLIRGSGKVKCWGNSHHASTCILQARRSVDYLSPDVWQFLGARETTKAALRENKSHILTWINGYFNENFTRLIID